MLRLITGIFVCFGFCCASCVSADTVFTYQGDLRENGSPANGTFDMDFTLWESEVGGDPVSVTLSMVDVVVTNGRFTVELDFGDHPFSSFDRWLEISVEGTTLFPRQPLKGVPYSIQTRGMFVDANKNVGIGTLFPSYPLHSESNIESPLFGRYNGNQGSKYGVYGRTDSSAATRGVFGYASASNGFTTGVQGRSDSPDGTGVSGYASATSGQNVGVLGQTDSPNGFAGYFVGPVHVSDRLFVGRDTPITGAEYFGLNAPVNAGFGGMYVSTDGPSASPFYGYAAGGDVDAYHYYNGATGKWHLNNNGVVMTVTDSGTVGIGTDNPMELFHVDAGGGQDALRATCGNGIAIVGINEGGIGVFGSTNGTASVGVDGHAKATSSTNYGVRGRSDSATGYDFFAAGAGINYGASSSARWKNDLLVIQSPLQKIGQLRGVTFKWDAEHGGHHDIGMIAEEVGKVLPEIVNYEENGVDAIGMDYSKLTPLLVEAVKELNDRHESRIESLVNEIAAVRKENAALRERVAETESIINGAFATLETGHPDR